MGKRMLLQAGSPPLSVLTRALKLLHLRSSLQPKMVKKRLNELAMAARVAADGPRAAGLRRGLCGIFRREEPLRRKATVVWERPASLLKV